MVMKTTGRVDMSFLPAGIHKPAKSDFNNICVDLTAPPPPPTHKHIHTHASTHMHVRLHIETHKQELLFNGIPKTLKAVYRCATGKPTNLSNADLLYTANLPNCAGSCIRLVPPTVLQKQ